MGNVHILPGVQLPPTDAPPPTMTAAELYGITGYLRPFEQLKILHGRGFTRAWRAPTNGHVILERSHYEAVTRGQFGQPAANEQPARPAARPNRAAFKAQFGTKAGG